jgi:hypothetical protein
MPPAPVGGVMEILMRNATRVVTAALTAAVLTLLAAMPLVAAWRTPAEQPAAPVPINPLELMQQTTDLRGQQTQGLPMVY